MSVLEYVRHSHVGVSMLLLLPWTVVECRMGRIQNGIQNLLNDESWGNFDLQLMLHFFSFFFILVLVVCRARFSRVSLDTMIGADVAAAAVLISMGALLGRTTPIQLLLIGLVEIAIFACNEHLQLEILKVNARAYCTHWWNRICEKANRCHV